jgi:hypothetical protein
VLLSAIIILSMVAGTAVITAPVAAATNGGAVTVDDATGGVHTNHHWSTTANTSDGNFTAIDLDYTGTGTNLSKLSADDVSVTVAGSSVPVDSVSETSSEDVTVILASPQSIATDEAIILNTTANPIQNPFTSGSYSADIRLRNLSNAFQTDTDTFSVSQVPTAAYVNRTDTTYNSSTPTTLDVTYNMTGSGVSASNLVVALNNGTSFVATNASLGSVGQQGTAQLSFSSGTIAGTQSVTYEVFKQGAYPNTNATDTSTLTDIDATIPQISGVSFSESSGNMAISFSSDEKLGDSSGDITVEVTEPGATVNYTFNRGDFAEGGSGPYTYTLMTAQSFDDGDGTYTAEVTDAVDPAGNNGGTNGAGSSLTATHDYSSGGGLPNALYINKSDDTHDPSTDTTVTVSYNATGKISPGNLVVEIREGGTPINATAPSSSSGTTDITISGGTLSGDTLLTYNLRNSSAGTVNQTDQSWLNSTGGGFPAAPYINKSDDTHDPSTDTTLTVTYNTTGKIAAGDLRVQVRNSTKAILNSTSPSTTEGTTDILISGGTLSGDEELTYALFNTTSVTTNQTDKSWLNSTGGDTTAPQISNVLFGESSGDMIVQFDSDEQLGGSSGDISVQVTGPNGATYTFDRNQFSESGSGPYTYTLSATQAFDDGDGTYNAAVLDANDTAGNNGGINGEGSGLSASHDYSSGGGNNGGSQPSAPYINNTADTYASSTSTTLFVNYNATGLITSSDITLRINDSSDTTIASDSSLSSTQGEVSLSFGQGVISGDEQLTFEMVNSSTGTVEASDTTTLQDTVGSGGPFPDAPYINATNQTYKATQSTTVAVEYNASSITLDRRALSIELYDTNGNLIGFNSSLKNTEGTAQVTIRPGELPGGDQNITYKLRDYSSNQPVQATDNSYLLDNTPTGTIEGQLTDSDGNALSNTVVRIDGFGINKQAITDGTGNYSIEVPIGTYSIGVEPDGYSVRYIPGIEVGENETITQNIQVGGGGTLEGTVLNDTNDNPVPGSFILADGGDAGTYFIRGNMTGQFSKTIPEGNYSLSVYAGPGKTQKQNYQVNITEGQTTTQEIRMISTSLTNTSVSYLDGSGSPDMANISLAANLNFGMIQVQLLNNSGQQQQGGGGGGGMPNDLEGLGVADDDRFEISFTVEGYDPTTLLWGAKNVSWSTTQISPGTYNVTIETETVHLEGLNSPSVPIGPLRQRSPDQIAWPTGVKDKADLGWNNTVYLTLFDMSNVPEGVYGNLEGMTVTTNAQTFSRPRLVEKELPNGDTRDQLEVYVGAPGNTTYGADHDGFYEAFIPDDVLNEWGVDDPETELNTLYKGQSQNFNVNETQNGVWIELDITYSDGRVEVTSVPKPQFNVSIDSTNSPVTEGETLDVTANVTNNGTAGGTQTVTLDLDNTQVASQSVQLSADESKTVTLSYTTGSNDVGQPTATVTTDNDTASTTVDINSGSSPANFDVGITNVDGAVTAGDTVTVDYEVENTGDQSATQDIVFSVGGTTVETDASVSLNGGETATGTFTYTTQSSDTPDITVEVASDDDTASSTVTVNEPGNAVFDVTSVSAPDQVVEGDTIDVDATIENTGDADGTQTVELQVGGTTVTSQSVQLSAGSSTTVTLSYQTDSSDIGDLDLTVATEDASQTVTTSVADDASFDISIASDVTDDSVIAGSVADVVVDIENVGTGEGTETVTLSAGGEQLDSQTVTLAAGATTSVEFTVDTDQTDVGDLGIVVEGSSDSASTTITVEEQPDEASFDVTITDTNGPVTVGDDVSVTATVENVGELQETKQVDLVVRGTVRDSQNLTLAGSESTTVTFSYTTDDDDPPSIDAVVESPDDSDSETVTVERPGTFEVSINSTNEPVTASDDLEVDVSVENVGDTQTTETVELQFGGETAGSTDVTLAAGESTVTSFTVGLDASDEGENLLEAVSDNDSSTTRVTVGATAYFDVELTQMGSTDLSTTDGVVANEEVTVDATVENTGDETATQRVVITAGGERIASQRVELAPDESTTISGTFTPAESEVGDLEVRAASADTEDTDTLTVDAPATFELTASPPASLQENSTAEFDIDIQNVGDVEGTETVELFVDGSLADETTAQVGAGETTTATLEYTPDESDVGEVEIVVAGTDDTVETTVDVEAEPDPGRYELDIVDTNDPLTDGENISVTVAVENVGDLETTETLELDVNGTTMTTPLTLAGGETDRLTMTQQLDVGLEDGQENETVDVEVSAATANDTTTAEVIAPPEDALFRIDSLDAPSSAQEGDSVAVSLTVTNIGETSGTETVELTAGGDVLASQELTLAAGENETVTATVEDASAGDLTITGETSDQTASATVEVIAPDPAAFEITNTLVSDDAEAGSETTVTVNVENTGEVAGSTTVEVDIGAWSGTETISLDAGQQTSATVDVDVGQEPRAGTFERDVDVSTDDDSMTTTLTVDYGTIQSGIDAASSGDEVLIADGSYRESVTIRTADIELVAVGTVELDARASTAIEIRAPDVTVTGIGIVDDDAATGIRVAGDSARLDGVSIEGPTTGIEAVSGTGTDIRGVAITDVNTGVLLGNDDGSVSQSQIADAGTGLELRADSATVTGTVVENSKRGILLGPDSANAEIQGTDIFNNEFGIFLRGGSGHVVTNSNLEANGVSIKSESPSGSSSAVGAADTGLEATDNWWGSESGPDELDIVDTADTVSAPDDQQATEPYEDAEFVISDVTAPEEGIVGETLSVDVTVENVGDFSGLKTVELRIDGTTLATETVELDGAASTTITLDVTLDLIGEGDTTLSVLTDGDLETRDLTISEPTLTPEYYASQFDDNPNTIGNNGVFAAVQDWQEGKISNNLVFDIVQYWQDEEEVN